MRRYLFFSLGGFLATAVTYGPARMGFGLFLPEFRETFDLSIETAGFVASAAFFAFLIALPIASVLTSLTGPRTPVVASGLLASFGMCLVALAPNAAWLSIGVVIAASSAGLAWTPYNDAAARVVESSWREHALSIISTGTTVGVAAAGFLAICIALYGFTWRAAWMVFAAMGFAMAIVNYFSLRAVAGSPGSPISDPSDERPKIRIANFARPEAIPLFFGALSFGATNAIFLSFAGDRIENAGGLTGVRAEISAPIIFMAYGVFGIIGLFTAKFEERLGLVWLLRGIFGCSTISLALVALAPTSWPGVLISSGFQGGCVMTISAVFSFWSARLFPHLPSLSFTGVLLALATGSVIGPSIAALIAGRFGMEIAFIAAGLVSLLTALMLRRQLIEGIERSSQSDQERIR